MYNSFINIKQCFLFLLILRTRNNLKLHCFEISHTKQGNTISKLSFTSNAQDESVEALFFPLNIIYMYLELSRFACVTNSYLKQICSNCNINQNNIYRCMRLSILTKV